MDKNIPYRFPLWKDSTWNSYERQKERYEVVKPHLGFGQIGCEVGVYKGGFAEFLLHHCSKLYLVDTWYRSKPFWDTRIPKDSRVDTVISILSVYKSEIEAGAVEIVVDTSFNFLNNMPDKHFDFIYYDSSHKYEDTIRELNLVIKKIKNGGILFGDDYDPNPRSRQHGVYRAVNEFGNAVGAELILNSARQWGLRL